jgi:hypothetical protein
MGEKRKGNRMFVGKRDRRTPLGVSRLEHIIKITLEELR